MSKCVSKCGFHTECCEEDGCHGTLKEWDIVEDSVCGLSEMTYQCPNCNKGIINPTFNGTMACDKCSFEVEWEKFDAQIRGSESYMAHCIKNV